MEIKKIYSNKYLKSTLLIIIGLFLGWLFFYHSDETEINNKEQNIEKSTIWTCSMHPQIRMDKKGLCPICGMDLIPLEKSSSNIDDSAIVMTEEAVKLAEVQTTIVSKQQIAKEVRLYGKIQADERNLQTLPSHVSGRIEKLFVNFTGENINKGQIIATIYSPELVTAQQEFFEAIKIKTIQPKLYEATKEKLNQLKLSEKQIEDIENSGKLKSYFDVSATTSGVVITKKVNVGDYVQTGSPLYEVANLTQVWGLFDAYETDLPWINIGSQVNFTLLAVPGKEFKGNISFIDPVINPQTRIAKIRIELNNSSGIFKPEMLATGIVLAKLANSTHKIVIPESSVLWTGKRSIVYIKVTNTTEPTFRMREVTLGNYLKNSYEIVEGLSEGEEVVTNGTFNIDAASQLEGKLSMMNTKNENNSGGINMKEMGMGESVNLDKNNNEKVEKMKGMNMSSGNEHNSFKVSGNCEMCKDRIETTVKNIAGVSSANWDIKSKMLHLNYDNSKVKLIDIQKAIAKVGHDNGKQKAPDDVYNNLPECCKYR